MVLGLVWEFKGVVCNFECRGCFVILESVGSRARCCSLIDSRVLGRNNVVHEYFQKYP